jgi:hypothetical protein
MVMPDGVDVEQRNASLRGAIGSVRRPDGTLISVALLDSHWHDAHQEGLIVPSDSPIAALADHLTIMEAGGEPPNPDVEADAQGYYRVDRFLYPESR